MKATALTELPGGDQLKPRHLLVGPALVFTLVASGMGLFLTNAAIVAGPGMGAGDVLRLVHVLVLIVGLTFAAYRYAGKHHDRFDELALLLFLAAGVNLVVQLTGGASSFWQGLYLLLGGLASVAFSRRLVVALVLAVLFLETSNWLSYPNTPLVDLFRLVALFVFAVVGYNYMGRAERDRADRAEERLLRLNAGLSQLAAGDDDEGSVSPLSEDGQRAGQAEQLQRLDRQLEPLLELAERATGAERAVLLQVSDDASAYWLRLSRGAPPSDARFPISGSVFASLLREERAGTVRVPPPWDRDRGRMELHVVPIRRGEEPPWMLVLEAEEGEGDFFHPDRRAMARSIAGQMSEFQGLFRRQARHQLEELEHRELLAASEKLAASSRLAEIFPHLTDYATRVVRYDSFAVCLREEGEDSFKVVVAEGHRKDLVGRRYPLESPTWAAWVLRAREEPLAIRMERRSGMPILDPKDRTSATATSFLAVPLRAQQRVSGALLVTRKDGAFTARERRLLQIYANQAAVAIENAIVYERVSNLAATDSLTGLFNRRYFELALARELARVDRASSGGLALLLLDIDHFKSFNDTYGHAMGDMVLKKVATLLQDALRQGDVLARIGGEEFVVLLPQVSKKGALDSAERIRASVAKASIHPGGPRKSVTLSVGVALVPEHATKAGDLLEAADQALYAAKNGGRDRVEIFREGRDELE